MKLQPIRSRNKTTKKDSTKLKRTPRRSRPWACQDQAFGFEEKIFDVLIFLKGQKFFLQKS
jgi:hypothetical protein